MQLRGIVRSVVILAWMVLSLQAVQADELLQQIQSDLTALGYDVGPVDGEMGVKTQLAIGKFQQKNGLAVTGEPSFGLAVSISEQADAARNGQSSTSLASAAEPQLSAQEQCFRDKQQAAKAKQKKKKVFGALGRIGQKLALRSGDAEAVEDLNTLTTDVQDASELAKEFGISQSDAQDCLDL